MKADDLVCWAGSGEPLAAFSKGIAAYDAQLAITVEAKT